MTLHANAHLASELLGARKLLKNAQKLGSGRVRFFEHLVADVLDLDIGNFLLGLLVSIKLMRTLEM